MTTARTGPMTFLAGAIGGWILIRCLFLILSVPITTSPPLLVADTAPVLRMPPAGLTGLDDPLSMRTQTASRAAVRPAGVATIRARPMNRPAVLQDTAAFGAPRDEQVVAAQSLLLARMLAQRTVARGPLAYGRAAWTEARPLTVFTPAGRPSRDRWTLSAGLHWRGGSDRATLGPGLPLGGSQAWARLGWEPGSPGTQVFARLNSAGRLGDAAEAAVGVAVRPIDGLPVQLVAERRQRIGSAGRSAFAAYAVGGADVALGGWRLETYGAAGVVGVARQDGFAEAAARAQRPFVRLGALELSAGGGAWGAAQPGTHRIDVGPVLSVRSEQASSARLAVDWRQRVAGNATPESGPALTLSVDF